MTQPSGHWTGCDRKKAIEPQETRLRAKRKFGLSPRDSVLLHRKRRSRTIDAAFDLAIELARRSRTDCDKTCGIEFDALVERLRRSKSRLSVSPSMPLAPGTRCFYVDRGPRGARAYGCKRVVSCRWRYMKSGKNGGLFMIFKKKGAFAAIPSQLVVTTR
jgi:hypothetical protein